MTNTNLINYKDIQNTDIAKNLHKLIAQTLLYAKLIKNPYLKDQLQRSSTSILHNFTKAMSTNNKPATTIKYLFSAYGSARESRRWLMMFHKMNLITSDISSLTTDYLTLCYQLISMLNTLIEKNNIVWSTDTNKKIYYQESERLNLFNTLETLILATNELLNKLPDDYIKWKMISDCCSVLLNIEEGNSYQYYQNLMYCKFLFTALQQLYVVQADLETLIAIKDIDPLYEINVTKATDILKQYTIASKILIKLLNNTQAKALQEQSQLEALKKQYKKELLK